MRINIFFIVIAVAEIATYIFQHFGLIARTPDFNAGSFDNISGLSAYLSFCLPICLFQYNSVTRQRQWYFGVLVVLISVTILSLKSRSGILCIIVAFLPYTKGIIRKSICFTMPILISFLCILKNESTMGRWFVLQRTLELIRKHPFWGLGRNGFESKYMLCQADYFIENPDSRYVLNADNLHHPLNEYLYILSNYGLVGGLLFVTLFIEVWLYWKRHPSKEGNLGIHIICSILVFSFFSYPFHYFFSWVILLLAIYLIFKKAIRRFKFIGYIIIGSLSIPYVYFEIEKMYLQIEWHHLMHLKTQNNVTTGYDRLYKYLCSDCRFLYNYAFELFQGRRFEESLIIAKECNQLIADYDLTLLLGDIYCELGQTDKAIESYELAHNMVPNRFAPLCAIYDIYRKVGNDKQCLMLAERILKKNIKVQSKETMEYVNYIRDEYARLIKKSEDGGVFKFFQ